MPSATEIIEELDALDRRSEFRRADGIIAELADWQLEQLLGRGNGFTKLRLFVESLRRSHGSGHHKPRPQLSLIRGGLDDAAV